MYKFHHQSQPSEEFSVDEPSPPRIGLKTLRYVTIAVGVYLAIAPIIFFIIAEARNFTTSDPAIALLFNIYGGSCLLIFVFAFRMAIKQRFYHPFRARSFPLVFIACFAGSAILFWVCIRDDLGFVPCDFGRWIANILYPAVFIPYIIRGWRLSRIFNPSLSDLPPLDRQDDGWNSLDQKKDWSRFGDKRLLVYFAICMVPFLILGGVAELYPQIGVIQLEDSQCTGDSIKIRWFWVVLHFLEAALFAYILYRIRNVWDEFSIRSELIVVFAFQFVFFLFHTILVLSPDFHFGENEFDDPALYLLLLRSAMTVYVSIIWPTLRTLDISVLPYQGHTALKSYDKLRNLLGDSVSFLHFSNFMETTQYASLLHFYVQAELFKDTVFDDNRSTIAWEIYNKFLVPDGVESSVFLDVIPEILIDDVKMSLEQEDVLTDNIFNGIEQITLSQMESRCLVGFLKSEEYQQLITEKTRSRSIHEALLMANMMSGSPHVSHMTPRSFSIRSKSYRSHMLGTLSVGSEGSGEFQPTRIGSWYADELISGETL